MQTNDDFDLGKMHAHVIKKTSWWRSLYQYFNSISNRKIQLVNVVNCMKICCIYNLYFVNKKNKKTKNKHFNSIQFSINTFTLHILYYTMRGFGGHDRMVIGFTTTYAISAYHHWCCEFESRSGQGVQHYVIKFVSDLRSVVFSGFSGSLHQ